MADLVQPEPGGPVWAVGWTGAYVAWELAGHRGFDLGVGLMKRVSIGNVSWLDWCTVNGSLWLHYPVLFRIDPKTGACETVVPPEEFLLEWGTGYIERRYFVEGEREAGRPLAPGFAFIGLAVLPNGKLAITVGTPLLSGSEVPEPVALAVYDPGTGGWSMAHAPDKPLPAFIDDWLAEAVKRYKKALEELGGDPRHLIPPEQGEDPIHLIPWKGEHIIPVAVWAWGSEVWMAYDWFGVLRERDWEITDIGGNVTKRLRGFWWKWDLVGWLDGFGVAKLDPETLEIVERYEYGWKLVWDPENYTLADEWDEGAPRPRTEGEAFAVPPEPFRWCPGVEEGALYCCVSRLNIAKFVIGDEGVKMAWSVRPPSFAEYGYVNGFFPHESGLYVPLTTYLGYEHLVREPVEGVARIDRATGEGEVVGRTPEPPMCCAVDAYGNVWWSGCGAFGVVGGAWWSVEGRCLPGPILPVEDPDEVWAVFWAGGSEVEEHEPGEEREAKGPAFACTLSVGPARAGWSIGTVSLGIFGAIIRVPLSHLHVLFTATVMAAMAATPTMAQAQRGTLRR
ncbi:MAG: hypothetical protein DRN06_06635, partial [Thermoprotei archaeon]